METPGETTSIGPEPSGSSPSTVAWPIALWALVALAVGAMNQPCGNVLGRGENYFRLYSRVSPIVCVADVMYFLVVLILGSLDRGGFVKNMKYELARRFGDELAMRFDDELTMRSNNRLAKRIKELERGSPDELLKQFITELAAYHDSNTLARRIIAQVMMRLTDNPPMSYNEVGHLCEDLERRFCKDLAAYFEDVRKYWPDQMVMNVGDELVMSCVDEFVISFVDKMATSLHEDRTADHLVGELVRRRGGDYSNSSIKAAEDPTLVRWVLLGVSVVPPTVKLVSMDGLWWTKTWALMFFVSIIFGEVVRFLQSRQRTFNGHQPKWRANNWLVRLLDFPTYLAFSLQFALLLSLASGFLFGGYFHIDVHGPILDSTVSITFTSVPVAYYFFGNPRPKLSLVSYGVLTSLFMVTLGPFRGDLEVFFGPHWIATQPRQLAELPWKYQQDDWFDTGYMLGWIVVILLGQVALQLIIFELVPHIIMSQPLKKVFWADTHETALAALMFVLTLVCCLLYYGLLYNSEGTVNPSWTVGLG
ncbi:hypothetical protein DL766_010146 [Monosporascus sp. MC13-8B]|uniref:Uncharacterized protein n=1 Tax=Monosporascus cannonballus TaxID=155416 RepID=A0ABY0HA88_9PEZI|nr:hypothetical protein DL762_005150 [Monosporascus cannonballus]RYP09350.1 hypothetical protein DL766_010146 [Monosporascus sp. MC13-8B]